MASNTAKGRKISHCRTPLTDIRLHREANRDCFWFKSDSFAYLGMGEEERKCAKNIFMGMAVPEEEFSPTKIRQWMNEFRLGDREAAGRLVEHFYPELRRMAGLQIRQERPDHTLQATALVNELYLQLMRVKNLPPAGSDEESERLLFLGLAGFLMKRLLIHHARPLRKQFEKLELDEGLASAVPGEADLVEVEELLVKLASLDPVLAQVVQMRVFDGLTREQIAERLNTSVRSVARHWEFARRWLSDAMGIREPD